MLVEVAVARDRHADVARVDRFPGVGEASDPARLEEFGDDLRLDRLERKLLGHGVTASDHHPLDQTVDFGQRLRGRVDDERLEALPLRLPLVPIESGFDHGGILRRRTCFQTPAARLLTLAGVNVLLVGSGGREHALAWKLCQSTELDALHAAPGNPGIAAFARCHPVRGEDAEGLLGLAREVDAELVVIGPEAPLVAGIADELRRAGLHVFGPGREAARIEGSKGFAKDVMRAAGVQTAELLAAPDAPCVVKVDGLTAGKGVYVCREESDLEAALRAAGSFGGPIVVEELLEGDEVSVFALCDGLNVVALGAAKDYKRAEDGDAGPNTGGMGAFSPVPELAGDRIEELVGMIHRPVIDELARRGTPFVGVLYAGLMLTEDGPRVLEFNCRFGDPEAQTILPLLEGDILETLATAADGDVSEADVESSRRAAVTVALTARDYPASGDAGTPIEGVDAAERTGALVFHAGTALHDGRLVTNGGRILNVTGLGENAAEARAQAYEAAELI